MSDSEQAQLKAGHPPAMKDRLRLRKRIPLPKHHKEKAESPKVVEGSEENDKPKTVVISQAQVQVKEVFSPEAARAIHEKQVPTHIHDAEKDEIDQTEVQPNKSPLQGSNSQLILHLDGEGGKSSGGKSKRESISEGRKAGINVIQTLCQKFNVGHLENEMQEIFKLLKTWHNLTAVAAAVFVSVYRREQPIFMKQILPELNVTPPVTISLLGAAMKKVESYLKEMLPAPPQLSTGSTTIGAVATCLIPEITQYVRSILPNLKVQDPFLSSVEITERVYNSTIKIVQIFERRTKHSSERRIITIAAGFLAWQSCHYYDKGYNSQVPFTELKKPNEESDFQKYLTLTQLNIDDITSRHVKRSVTLISKELLQLFQHMTWIGKTRKCTSDIPKYLELIFQSQEMIIDALNQEEETERLNHPIVAPIIPRELTAEEEAILNAPELSEKDLPDAELSKYLRSELELNSINVHLSFSADKDSDLAELKKIHNL